MKRTELLEEVVKKHLGVDYGWDSPSVREEKSGFRMKWTFKRQEFPTKEWKGILELLENLGYIITEENNSYEPNWEPEEPPEWVPTIYFKKIL